MKTTFSLLLLGVMLTLRVGVAGANDSSSSGVGGRWRMLKSEHKQVQMVSEHVGIVQQPDGDFETTADFVFRNHGPATTVTMGFPEERGGDAASDRLSLFHFATWVDGRRVVARRRKLREEEDAFEALWVKKVHFGRGATRHVRVRYLSQSGGAYSSGDQWVSYDFTGGNWRGKVLESVLDIRFLPGWYRFETLEDALKDNPTVTRQGASFRFRWANWQAQNSFALNYCTEFPNELALMNSESGRRSFLAIEPGAGLLRDGVPAVTDCGDAILWKGRLWVRAQKLTQCQWDEKRHGMVLRVGKRSCFISARGAVRASQKWPLDPDRPFWLSAIGGYNRFYVPARLITQRLGGKFTVYNSSVLYKNGSYGTELK